jgi:hypothetical protein
MVIILTVQDMRVVELSGTNKQICERQMNELETIRTEILRDLYRSIN